MRETAFNIQVLGGKWFAIRNLLYTLPTPQKVQMLRWVSGCSMGGGLPGLMETPGMGSTEPFRLGLSHHPSSGAEQSWAWGTSLGTGWDLSPWQTWLIGAHGWVGQGRIGDWRLRSYSTTWAGAEWGPGSQTGWGKPQVWAGTSAPSGPGHCLV